MKHNGSVTNLRNLAIAMEHRRNVAVEVFGPMRAHELEQLATAEIYRKTTVGLLNSFELVMQIEAEYPGRAEEFIKRAADLLEESEGRIVEGWTRAMWMVLMTERHKNG